MTTGKTRFAYIDQFRGWAVLFMIETHVLNTFLRQDLFATPWYKWLDFVNGLVAPSFLFLAGYSFALVAIRKWNDFLSLNSVFRKQIRRYLLILLIGYALHMPGNSFRVLFAKLKWGENSLFWGVDILHCIAMSLILMSLLVIILRRQKIFFFFIGIAGAAIILFTPLVQTLPIASYLDAPFVGYIQRIRWSQFPLFPWMAYLLFGAVCSYTWQLSRQKNREDSFFKYNLTFGLYIVFLTSLFVYRLLHFIKGPQPFYFMKLGIVIILLCFFHWWETKKQDRPRLVTLIGQESLLAYAFHITFIYVVLWNLWRNPLIDITGKIHSPLEIAGMALFLIAITTVSCLYWHKAKEKNPKRARWLHLALWGIVIIIFSLH